MGSNVFGYGHVAQAELYSNRTVEELAEYVGKKYSKEMRALVKTGEDGEPEEPDPPKDKNSVTNYDLMILKSDYEDYKKLKREYECHKAKVFLLILGQCTLNMRNRVEQDDKEKYKKMEEEYDVAGLLETIKRLSYTENKTKYSYWMMARDIKKLATIKQQHDETLAMYHKRFINLVDVIEARWGSLAPTNVPDEDKKNKKESEEESKKKSRNKFLACMFMDGANKTKYGKCIADLSNSYLSKNDKYPKTVATALTYLSHFSDCEYVSKKKPDETINLGLLQYEDRVCYKCGEKGHIATYCKKDREKLVNAYQEEEEATEESTALALPHAPRQWRE